tara:strand:+ start:868 stop:1377 length:510 start_codon:yes stop_codon:yes gene_type:complete
MHHKQLTRLIKTNFSSCEKYYNEFKQNALELGYNIPNIFENTRERPIIEYRQLFQTILRNKYGIGYTSIAKYFTYKGRDTNHASVINSIKRTINTNYYSVSEIADIYDEYFQDKKDERIAKLIVSTPKLRRKYNNKLVDLIKNIPKDREDEIFDLIDLRIKSWSWKTKI